MINLFGVYPKISIIIPTVNASKTLSIAIESVIDQSYQNFELLIIDGLSTDDTIEIAKKYNDDRIKIISEKDSGIYDAMNKGIRLAKGNWIYFLGSDDRFYNKEVLDNLSSWFKSENEILYGNVVFSISGKVYDGKFTKLKLLQKNICHQAIFTRKQVFEKTGNFEIKYKALADWHLNMKWFNDRSIKHKYIGQTIAYYYEDGYSFNNQDTNFMSDWNRNVTQHFPFAIRMCHLIKVYYQAIKRYLSLSNK
jgi:glycosyltransferase involved in cell wall biosynthesis